MSRTYNTTKIEFRDPEQVFDYDHDPESFYCLKLAGVKTKKKKKADKGYHWMTTPMWFIREFMNRPARKASKRYEREVVKMRDLEDVDFPIVGRKPHIYYW